MENQEKALARGGKTYNEVLNEKGTYAFLSQKLRDSKTGKIQKGLIFVPSDKVPAVNDLLGCNLESTNQKIVIRSGLVVGVIYMDSQGQYTGRVLWGQYKDLTARGQRLNDKTIEGVYDLLITYGGLTESDISVEKVDSMPCIPDCYKSRAGEYDIDDLLGL